MVLALAVLVTQAAGGADAMVARSPAYARDGRLAVAVAGDLWVVPSGGGAPVRITRGAAWDRDPAWTPDGRALVYSSDAAGNADIWRIEITAAGAAAAPVRLTTNPAPESEPAVGPDGVIVFVRGTGAAADLWRRHQDGSEERITSEPGADRSPAFSSTGMLAWVAERDGTASILLRERGGATRTAVSDMAVTRIAWAPDGERFVFGARGRRSGIWVAAARSGYLAMAGEGEGTPAWAPDGSSIVVAPEPPADVGYNGDPDRLDGRSGGEEFGAGLIGPDGAPAGLRRLAAPAPVSLAGEPVMVDWAMPRADRNASAFDRLWSRTARLYLGYADGSDSAATPALRAWRDAARRHRARALRAESDAELAAALHALLRDRPPLRTAATGRAAVSSAHPAATAAGLEILEAGGNVVDAAVAVSFALGVVEPDASGMGGYGVALIHLEGMNEPAAIEFMTKVPMEATRENPLMQDLPPDGPRRVNVPGVVAGMWRAWERHGSLPWARLLEPALRLADNGFVIDDAFATTLRREWESFAKYESSRALFFRDGRPLGAGDTLRNPDLAWTLRQVAAHGADAFYRGEVAKRLVTDLRAGGNPITLEDMAMYDAANRRALRTTYRGHTVYSGPPPVTGGATLVAKLNLLEQAPSGGFFVDDASKLHAMIEAWKLQPSTGGRITDPDMSAVDVSPFESKDTARARWACFDSTRLSRVPAQDTGCAPTSSPAPPPDTSEAWPADPAPQPCDDIADGRRCRSTGTTAFAVADGRGNMVAVTQTLGTWGGNFYVTPGLGFLYNDKLVAPRPADGRGFGGSVPGARVGTVIAPTLVFRGTGQNKQPLLATGAAGNAWITSAVYEIVVGVIDHGLGPQQALELPRFLPGGRDGPIQIEDGFSPAVIERLEAMGHRFRRISLPGELRMGYGAAVMIRDGQATAGADPRRSGAAAALR